jgi:hypothetical protein
LEIADGRWHLTIRLALATAITATLDGIREWAIWAGLLA